MSVEQNTQIAEKFVTAMNQRDFSISKPYQDENYRISSPGAPDPMTPEQNQAYLQGFLTAFPDLKFDILQRIAQDEYVVLNWRATGTHTGPMATPSGNQIPPTGKHAVVFGSTTYQVQGGKVVRAYNHWDMTSLLGQLGLMPGI